MSYFECFSVILMLPCNLTKGDEATFLLGFPSQGCPVINSRVWFRETMFSQVVSYDFPLHGPLHEYFLYLASAPPPPPHLRPQKTQKALRTWTRLFVFEAIGS